MCRGDQLHSLECLDPALCLAGLRGLGAETFHIAVHVRYIALLFLEGRLLVRQLFAAHPLEGTVVAAVEGRALLFDMQDLVAHAVEKITVVRDKQQGPAILFQPGLEPDHGVQVEVVCRFVEKQEIGSAHQGTCEIKPHPPATRKIRQWAHFITGRKAEPAHQAGGAAVGLIATDMLQFAVQVGDALAVAIMFCCRQFALRPAQALITIQYEFNGGLFRYRGLLCNVCNDPAGRILDGPLFRAQRAQHQRKQAGFSAAIGPSEAGLLPWMDLEAGAFEQQAWPATQGDVIELQHGVSGPGAKVRGPGCENRGL